MVELAQEARETRLPTLFDPHSAEARNEGGRPDSTRCASASLKIAFCNASRKSPFNSGLRHYFATPFFFFPSRCFLLRFMRAPVDVISAADLRPPSHTARVYVTRIG
jgi:hypothetical protein